MKSSHKFSTFNLCQLVLAFLFIVTNISIMYKTKIYRGVNAIVYMVDAADLDKIEASRNELHNLLEKPQVHIK